MSYMIIELLRIVVGLFLILFVPGYAFTWALYPKKDDLNNNERIAFSFAISISLVMIFVLFMDLVLGVDTTPVNIIICIIILTLFSLAIWRLHLYIINKNLKFKIIRLIIASIEKVKKSIRMKYHV